MEAALKMIYQARLQRGETKRTTFISLGGGYHGDTVGAMSAGHSATFHRAYRPLLFPTREVMSPAVIAAPIIARSRYEERKEGSRGNARGECIEELKAGLDEAGETASAFVIEPRVQGAAGMLMHPHGYLAKAAEACREHGVWLLLDEVMTGFGRTGTMFAHQSENVTPDVLAIAKGMTGGYLPLAATTGQRRDFRGFPWRLFRTENLFSRSQLHGKCAGLRGGAGQPENFRR